MDIYIWLQLGILLVLVLYVIKHNSTTENLCINTKFGPVTSVPASAVVNANMALVHSTSLGQAPLGDPRYWQAYGSPITQGQYSLRQPLYSLADTRNPAPEKAKYPYPVYTEKPLPPQCTPVTKGSSCSSCVG